MKLTNVAFIFLVAAVLVSCGDDSPSGPTAPPPPPPIPSANVQVSGNGSLVIRPSIDPTFCCTTEFPIQIRETAGGNAIWNFFRVSYLLNGAEVERAEQGAGVIRDAGFRDITANSTTNVVVFIRDNAVNFNNVRITMGFADTKDGRAIERTMSLAEFDGILINPIPGLLPEGTDFAVEVR